MREDREGEKRREEGGRGREGGRERKGREKEGEGGREGERGRGERRKGREGGRERKGREEGRIRQMGGVWAIKWSFPLSTLIHDYGMDEYFKRLRFCGSLPHGMFRGVATVLSSTHDGSGEFPLPLKWQVNAGMKHMLSYMKQLCCATATGNFGTFDLVGN